VWLGDVQSNVLADVLAAEQCVAKDDVLAAEQRVVIAPTQSRLG